MNIIRIWIIGILFALGGCTLENIPSGSSSFIAVSSSSVSKNTSSFASSVSSFSSSSTAAASNYVHLTNNVLWVIYMADNNDLSAAADVNYADIAYGADNYLRPSPQWSLSWRTNCSDVIVARFGANKGIWYPLFDNLQKGIMIHDGTGMPSSGSYQSLQTVLQFIISNYTYQKLFLVIWGHGAGFVPMGSISIASNVSPYRSPARATARKMSVALDDGDNTSLTETEIAHAIKTILPGGKVALLGMDACMMQSVEEAYQFKDVCNYYVASPSREPTYGWPYSAIFQACNGYYANPNPAPNAATNIVQQYSQFYASTTGQQYLEYTWETPYLVGLKMPDAVTNAAAALDRAAEWFKAQSDGGASSLSNLLYAYYYSNNNAALGDTDAMLTWTNCFSFYDYGILSQIYNDRYFVSLDTWLQFVADQTPAFQSVANSYNQTYSNNIIYSIYPGLPVFIPIGSFNCIRDYSQWYSSNVLDLFRDHPDANWLLTSGILEPSHTTAKWLQYRDENFWTNVRVLYDWTNDIMPGYSPDTAWVLNASNFDGNWNEGAMCDYNDEQWFKFTVTTPGNLYMSCSDDEPTCMDMYDCNTNHIAANTNFIDGTLCGEQNINVSLSSGVYYLRLNAGWGPGSLIRWRFLFTNTCGIQ
jgi:hypothetical protein